MQIIIILEILVIFLVTLSLLEHYCSRTVQLYVKILVFIPWFCTFLNIVLVPLDVFYTLKRKEDPAQYKDSYDTMVTIWEVVYWTSFVFTWLILPVLQEYVDAGDFTPKERIAKSIKINLIIYGAMAGLGVLFVGYLALSGKAGFQSIMEFCITFGNCFGIFLIVICLGFGLVHIPKRHFQQVDKEVNLRYYHYQISTVEEQKSNLQFDLEELIKLIHLLSKRKDILAQEKRLLSQILQDVPEKMVKEIENTVSETNHIIAKEYGSLNLSKIVSLNKQVKKKVNELRRIENKWEMTLQHAFFLEDVIESKHSIDWRIRSVFYIERKGKCGRFLDTLEWIWHVKLEQIFYFITGTFFICISIGVFFAETLTFDNHHFLTLDSFLQAGDSFAKSQLVCLIPLCYLSFCVYSALFNMKLAGLYGLYPHQQTDASSLVFSALNFSRVSSPLVFNFLQMMKLQGTAFNIVMGDVNLAYSFTKYFPLILIFLILCNAFEIYGRILGWVGLSSYEFSEELSDEKIEEGKKLLYRARNNKERNFLTLNSTNLRNYQTYATRGKISDYYTFDIESTRVTRAGGSVNFSTQPSFTKSEKSPFKSSDKTVKPLMRGKQSS